MADISSCLEQGFQLLVILHHSKGYTCHPKYRSILRKQHYFQMTISAAIWNILLLPLVLARVYVYMAQAGVTGEEEKNQLRKCPHHTGRWVSL